MILRDAGMPIPIFIMRMQKYLLDGVIIVPKNSASYLN